jgi:hypothetical protein
MCLNEYKDAMEITRRAWKENRLEYLHAVRKQIFLTESLLEDYVGNLDLIQKLNELKVRTLSSPTCVGINALIITLSYCCAGQVSVVQV